MNKKYEELRSKAYAALRALTRECEEYKEAQMLVGSAETEASLRRKTVRRSIDTEWVERIEAALPSLDIIVRRPTVAIEDVEEVLPIELTRRVSEKSIKHLARHTNMIREVNGDEVTPSHLLNVFREETLLTYENRFINTLLHRLSAFITLRYRALAGGSGVEQCYQFEYKTEFEHPNEDEGINRARVGLSIELTTPPPEGTVSEAELELCARYRETFARIEKMHLAILAFMSSPFAQALGRSFVRPPVIRTNAILKNQHFRNCLLLWEYIESCDKAGYSMSSDAYAEMPSNDYVSDLYSAVALEYAQFFHGIVGDGAERKLLASKHLGDVYPDFSSDLTEEELEDYRVYDSEYRKTVPVSRLMNNKKKLSEDELRIREAIVVALRADEILTAEQAAAEAEARRLEQERRAAEAERKKREAAAARDPIAVRYKRSFLSRLIQSDDSLKNYYGVIKNELLAYERVRAQLSFRGESFRRGRATISAINILGKTLYLYLDLPVEKYGNMHFVSASGKEDMPILVKVRNDRSLEKALRLIAEMMQAKGIARTDRTPENYYLPYEDDDALIARGLIKVILPKGVTKDEYDTLVKAGIYIESGHGGIESVEVVYEEPTEKVEEPAPEETAPAPVAIRYKRSFLSRLIQADDALKGYYGIIKNELLAYERVRAQLSFRAESFRCGRATISSVNILGKTLYLYLDLPAEKYGNMHFVKPSGKDGLPILVKVRNDRSLEKALRLITEMMQAKGINRTDRAPEDYYLPYEDDDALIARGLIKVILPKDADADAETVKADIASMFGNAEKPAVTEALTEEAAEEAEEAEEVEQAVSSPVAIRYKRSFLSRLIQSDDALKGYYGTIKNELLAYERVRAQLSFRAESFRRGRATISSVNILGKTLYLYLDLPVEKYGNMHFVSASGKEDMPILVKVRNDRSLEKALRLIGEMMQEKGIVRTDRTPENYYLPYEDDDALIARGLIKVILPKDADADAETVKADIASMFGNAEKPAVTEALTEEVAEAVEPEVEPEAEDTPFGDPIAVRYKRSYLSRLIQADDEVKDCYNTVKNELLAYQRVKARTSFRLETFKQGRLMLAHVNVLGKTLLVYLNLSAEKYGNKHFVSPSDKADTPILVKVRNDRSLEQAIRLIGEMMEENGIARTDRAAEDFRLPYEETDALIEQGLIKVILPTGAADGAETVKADISAMLGAPERAPEAEEVTEEVAEVTEPVAEAVEPEVEPEAEDTPFGDPIAVRYKRSYLSRLIQADDEVKDCYNTVKNELLAYQRVKARTSFRLETFKQGRLMLAHVNVLGKTLLVYLNLSAEKYGNKHFVSPSDKADTPILVKVRNDRSLEQAIRLIGEMMEENGIARTDRAAEDFRLPYEETDALIEQGLIKVILPTGAADSTETVKADISLMLSGGWRAPEDVLAPDEAPVALPAERPAAPATPVAVAPEAFPVIEAVTDTPAVPTPMVEEAMVNVRAPEREEEEPTATVEEPTAPTIEAPAEPIAEPVEEPEIAPEVEEITEEAPEAPTEEAAVEATEEKAAEPTEDAEADDDEDDEDDQPSYFDQSRIGIERSTAAEEVDLSTMEVGDVAFAHEINVAMVEGLDSEYVAVKVSETPYVGRVLTKVRLDPIPAPIKKRMRPRVKNLVFTDSTASVGLFVPYTRAEYHALSRKERKAVFLDAVNVQEYNRSVSRLALLHHLGDERFFEALAYYETHCRDLAEALPEAPEWAKWLKEL